VCRLDTYREGTLRIRRGDALLITLARVTPGDGFVVDGETAYALLRPWDDPGLPFSWRALPL
jgi:hypothetical protein